MLATTRLTNGCHIETNCLDNVHFAAPLLRIADDQHVPLQPLLCKVWIACRVLELGLETSFTALVLLHRYYAAAYPKEEQLDQREHPSDNACTVSALEEVTDWKWVSAACLVLSMKAEEEVRRLRDVINLAHILDFGRERGPTEMIFVMSSQPPELNDDYWKAKASIVATEHMVLRMLQFDITVSHPHRLVVLIADDFGFSPDIVHQAWRHLNDALFYPLALTQDALSMACGAIELIVKRGVDKYYTEGARNVKRSMMTLKAAAHHLESMQCPESSPQEVRTIDNLESKGASDLLI